MSKVRDMSGAIVRLSYAQIRAFAELADGLALADGAISSEEQQLALGLMDDASGGLVAKDFVFDRPTAEAALCLLAHPTIDNQLAQLTPERFVQVPQGSPSRICGVFSFEQQLDHRLRIWQVPNGEAVGSWSPHVRWPQHQRVVVWLLNGDATEARHQRNVADMASLFRFHGFDPENILMQSAFTAVAEPSHVGPVVPATRSAIEGTVLPWLRERVDAQTLLITYLTGHGSHTDMGASLSLEDDLYGTHEIAEHLGSLTAGAHVAIADQCFSNTFPHEVARATEGKEQIAFAPEASTTVTACQSFIPFVIEGLERGIDPNQDGQTDLQEVLQYALHQYNAQMRHEVGSDLQGSYRSSMPALTMDNVEAVLADPRPLVIDVSAPWCGPCQQLAPKLDQLRLQIGDAVRYYKIYDASIDAGEAVIGALVRHDAKITNAVHGYPTLLYVSNGTLRGSVSGDQSAVALRKQLAAHFEIHIDPRAARRDLAHWLAKAEGVPTHFTLELMAQGLDDVKLIPPLYHALTAIDARSWLQAAQQVMEQWSSYPTAIREDYIVPIVYSPHWDESDRESLRLRDAMVGRLDRWIDGYDEDLWTFDTHYTPSTMLAKAYGDWPEAVSVLTTVSLATTDATIHVAALQAMQRWVRRRLRVREGSAELSAAETAMVRPWLMHMAGRDRPDAVQGEALRTMSYLPAVLDVTDEAVVALVAPGMDDSNALHEARMELVLTLVSIKGEEIKPLLPHIAETALYCAQHFTSTLQERALLLLWDLRQAHGGLLVGPTLATWLSNGALETLSPYRQRTAIGTLSWASAAERALLTDLLASDDAQALGGAANALSDAPMALKEDYLVPLFLHPDAQVRFRAVFALGEDIQRAHVPRVTLLLKDPNARVRSAAYGVLASLSERDNRPYIAEGLRDANPSVGHLVLHMILKMPRQRAIALLRKELPRVPHHVATSLLTHLLQAHTKNKRERIVTTRVMRAVLQMTQHTALQEAAWTALAAAPETQVPRAYLTAWVRHAHVRSASPLTRLAIAQVQRQRLINENPATHAKTTNLARSKDRVRWHRALRALFRDASPEVRDVAMRSIQPYAYEHGKFIRVPGMADDVCAYLEQRIDWTNGLATKAIDYVANEPFTPAIAKILRRAMAFPHLQATAMDTLGQHHDAEGLAFAHRALETGDLAPAVHFFTSYPAVAHADLEQLMPALHDPSPLVVKRVLYILANNQDAWLLAKAAKEVRTTLNMGVRRYAAEQLSRMDALTDAQTEPIVTQLKAYANDPVVDVRDAATEGLRKFGVTVSPSDD